MNNLLLRSGLLSTMIALVPAAVAGPEPPAPASPTHGEPSETCINGWITPGAADQRRADAIQWVREKLDLGAEDRLIVGRMRYFEGPENVEIEGPRPVVKRWYVEAYPEGDASAPGRWIARRTDVGEGVDYEAARESSGYEQGTWTAYEGEGVPYDPFEPFPCTQDHGPYGRCDWEVSGCYPDDGSEPKCFGPPPEVMGCLDGT